MIDTLKVGIVTALDANKCAVRIKYDDLPSEYVTNWLPVLQRGVGEYATYDLPNIGDQVLVCHLPNGEEEGFCVGAIPSDSQQPGITGMRAIKFGAGSVVLEGESAAVIINAGGGMSITGAVNITGNVIVSGTVTAAHFIEAN